LTFTVDGGGAAAAAAVVVVVVVAGVVVVVAAAAATILLVVTILIHIAYANNFSVIMHSCTRTNKFCHSVLSQKCS
jgi:hypothetical protein